MVKKPFAHLQGDPQVVRHASEVLEGETYLWNGRRVHPVERRFFRYNPGEAPARRNGVSNARESTAHVIAKERITKGCGICCRVGDAMVLLRLRDARMEERIDVLRPDVTGIVDWCVPYFHLAGRTIHIEVHFANAVGDGERAAALRSLGAPVLEFHLPRKYLNKIEIDESPGVYRSLIAAILRSGLQAGTWISAPPPAPESVIRNCFTAAQSADA